LSADYFNTIDTVMQAEYRDRGSKFTAFAFPVGSIDEFKEKLAYLKKEHPKATHHCFAYRIGPDGETFRVSDAGEPSGTAGRPILGQIDSKGLTNVLVVVVRYFGGTLLGVPGLINAYKTAASLVLQTTPVVRKPVMVKCKLHFDYTRMNEVMRLIKQQNCEVLKQESMLFCDMEIAVPKINWEQMEIRLGEASGVEYVVVSL